MATCISIDRVLGALASVNSVHRESITSYCCDGVCVLHRARCAHHILALSSRPCRSPTQEPPTWSAHTAYFRQHPSCMSAYYHSLHGNSHVEINSRRWPKTILTCSSRNGQRSSAQCIRWCWAQKLWLSFPATRLWKSYSIRRAEILVDGLICTLARHWWVVTRGWSWWYAVGILI